MEGGGGPSGRGGQQGGGGTRPHERAREGEVKRWSRVVKMVVVVGSSNRRKRRWKVLTRLLESDETRRKTSQHAK